jgi:hypothetical protein
MRGFRERITSFLLGHRKQADGREVPVIQSQHGTTTESARQQAAGNMRLNPLLRAQVEEMLTRMMGSRERGLAEARKRYPEANL